ncbi:MAG: aminotransferase class III-fold pyridoxal phosphate-dependent enzyme [Bacteroidota bacterium]
MKLFDVYPRFTVNPVRGEGSWVFDEHGSKYLDFYGGHAVISIGHSHPLYVERITEQLRRIGFYSNSIEMPLQDELAQKLGKQSGYEDYSLFLCNSGAEATENALKLASFYKGRKKLLAMDKAFHGRTSAAVAITDNPKIQAPINKGHEVVRIPLNDLEAARKELESREFAAIVIESVQGIGGIHLPEAAYLQALSGICEETETVLIMDEIQCGYGRTGKFFAHQYADIRADLIPVAKGMGNGFPIGGVLIHPKFEAWYGMLGTTFGGNHLACAAGIAVLDVIEEENLVPHAMEMGQYLMEGLSTIDSIKEIRGKGLMTGLSFDFPVKELRQKLLYDYHVFTGSSSQKEVLRLLPPMNVSQLEVDIMVDSLRNAVKSL